MLRRVSWTKGLGHCAVAGLALLTAACATKPDPTNVAAVQSYEEANDPIEPLNRYFFDLNNFLDMIILKPLATWYAGVLPQFAQNGVRNFMDNLSTPVVLANDMLQDDWDGANTTLTRFGANTTVGVLGLGDPATAWGYPRHDNDFGITLGKYGYSEGPYLFLPVLGPKPPRDLIGFGVDMAFDPLTYIYWGGPYTVPVTLFSLNGVDLRARNLATIDSIEASSVDYYSAIRSLYRQSRRAAVGGDKPADVNNLPDIDDINLDAPEQAPDVAPK